MITNPWRRRSEQAFLSLPEKLRKRSHFPWVRTNYLYAVSFNPLLNLWLFILSSLCMDCSFSSSYLHFNLSCSIRSLILLALVLEMGSFSVTGKKYFFVFDDSVCFYYNHILTNTGIDFVNNFQLIKSYFERYYFQVFVLFRILIFGVGNVLSMFHSFLLSLCKYKS